MFGKGKENKKIKTLNKQGNKNFITIEIKQNYKTRDNKKINFIFELKNTFN